MGTANLTATVTTRGVDKANRDLQRVAKNAKTTETNVSRMENRFKSVSKNASAAIAAIDGPLGGVSSRISSLTTVITAGTAAATAFGVSVAAVGAAVYQGVGSLAEYEVNLARTEAILRSTGGAVGFTAEQLREQAEQLALNTLGSVQGVERAQAKLLTFNRVSGEVFKEATSLAQDLAEVGFGSIESNAVQLGKALQEPITGITALTRVGVSFTDAQKEMIRSMIESGATVEAQRVILKALSDQVGGAGASVASDSLAGKTDTLGQRWEEFTMALAGSTGAISATKSGVDFLITSVETLTSLIAGPTLEEQFDATSDAVEKASDKVKDLEKNLKEAAEQTQAYMDRRPGNYAYLVAQERQLIAERELTLAIQERDDVIAGMSDRDQQRADAAQRGIEAQKKAESDAQAAREKAQAEADARQQKTESERAERQRQLQQAQTDDQARRITESLISEQEQRELAFIRQQEIINQSTLSEQEKYEALLLLQEDYSSRSAEIEQKNQDELKALRDKQVKDEEDRQRRIASERRKALDDTTEALRAGFGEQSGIYKAAAITQTTIDTYKSATGAYSALAPIPFVGPALGAAAAAAAVTAGLANVGRIRSAREQGGSLASGQASYFAEREAEVIVPSSNSRARTRQQMQQIMGEGGKQAVNIYNIDQSSGGVDVETSVNDNGDIVQIIRDTVSQDNLDPNSSIGKSLTDGFDLQRRLA